MKSDAFDYQPSPIATTWRCSNFLPAVPPPPRHGPLNADPPAARGYGAIYLETVSRYEGAELKTLGARAPTNEGAHLNGACAAA
jgi:hypothetical protein